MSSSGPSSSAQWQLVGQPQADNQPQADGESEAPPSHTSDPLTQMTIDVPAYTGIQSELASYSVTTPAHHYGGVRGARARAVAHDNIALQALRAEAEPAAATSATDAAPDLDGEATGVDFLDLDRMAAAGPMSAVTGAATGANFVHAAIEVSQPQAAAAAATTGTASDLLDGEALEAIRVNTPRGYPLPTPLAGAAEAEIDVVARIARATLDRMENHRLVSYIASHGGPATGGGPVPPPPAAPAAAAGPATGGVPVPYPPPAAAAGPATGGIASMPQRPPPAAAAGPATSDNAHRLKAINVRAYSTIGEWRHRSEASDSEIDVNSFAR
jgi:hypothetical protein